MGKAVKAVKDAAAACVNRPTHLAVEMRLTTAEAGAMKAWLPRARTLVSAGVMTVPAGDRDDLLAALDRLGHRLGEGQPAFEG